MSVFSPQLASKTVAHMKRLDAAKHQLQALSSEILSASKRTIFALHRGDAKGSAAELAGAQSKLKEGKQIVKKEPRIAQEGSWRAAQEEYAEAELFSKYLQSGTVSPVKEIGDDAELFLGGLSDMLGEVVRFAVLRASDGDRLTVEALHADAVEMVGLLLQMDLTGSLRTKVDQAKQHLRKLEEIRYDLAIRAQESHAHDGHDHESHAH
jgi:predicted translin family RNA/ssDNA-binding protein